MKYNKKSIERINNDCNTCRNNFMVWLSILNFGREKEDNIRKHIYNHCPPCKIFDKINKK